MLGSHLYTAALSEATFSVQISDLDGIGSTSASNSNFSVASEIVINSAQTVGSLVLPSGDTLVIAAGGAYTVNGTVQLGAAQIEVESGGTPTLAGLQQAPVTPPSSSTAAHSQPAATSPRPCPSPSSPGGTINTDGFNVTLAGNLWEPPAAAP